MFNYKQELTQNEELIFHSLLRIVFLNTINPKNLTSLQNYVRNNAADRNLGTNLWLQRFENAIDEKIADSSISNDWLANKMKISQRQLIRKAKAITGNSPRKYLRKYRLEKARDMLIVGTFYTVKETAHSVGFEKASYFSEQFESYFGKKPLEILKENGWR